MKRPLACVPALDAVRPQWTAGLLSTFAITAIAAGCDRPIDNASLLFDAGETELPTADRAAAFVAFSERFSISADGSTLEDELCGDIAPESEVVDLNADGNLEVFVSWGNTCTSGMTGRSLSLLEKTTDGSYRTTFAFPAATWTALETSSSGWPDLNFGGPGFCHPVWTRTDGNYDFKCNLPEGPGGCDNVGNICQ